MTISSRFAVYAVNTPATASASRGFFRSFKAMTASLFGIARTIPPKPADLRRQDTERAIQRELLAQKAAHHRDRSQSRAASSTEAELRGLVNQIFAKGPL